MELTDNKIWLWGLLISCPMGNEAHDCPLKEIRTESVKKKYDFIENLPPDKIDELVKHHIECLNRKENELFKN